MHASGASREKKNNKNYYDNLVKNYPKYIPSRNEYIIKVDIPRTYSNLPYFKIQGNLEKLRNVLLAITRRNSTVAYCQGFNFIIGRLLTILDNEEDVFWLFIQVIEEILPTEFYCELCGMMGDCALSLKLLKNEDQKLIDHIQGNQFDIFLQNLIYKWFVSLFVENTSKETFLDIWDAMFCDGNIVLFRAAVGLITLLRDKIMKMTEVTEITDLFETEIYKFTDHENLMKCLLGEKVCIDIDMDFIHKERKELYNELEDSIIKAKNISEVKIDRDKCDYDFPFCVCDLKKANIQKFVVLKELECVKIEENFYTNTIGVEEKIKNLKEKQKKDYDNMRDNPNLMTEWEKMKKTIDIFSQLLIERKKHSCGCKKETHKNLFSKKNSCELECNEHIPDNYLKEMFNLSSIDYMNNEGFFETFSPKYKEFMEKMLDNKKQNIAIDIVNKKNKKKA